MAKSSDKSFYRRVVPLNDIRVIYVFFLFCIFFFFCLAHWLVSVNYHADGKMKLSVTASSLATDARL